MFDRCRNWRRKLSQRADGALPVEQWGALDDHLARCARCQAAERADNALHDVLGLHAGLPDPREARAFDNRVLAALRAARAPIRLTDLGWRWVQARWNALPLAFLTQMAGGALAAASLTALCLQPAAHSTVPVVDSRAASERSLIGAAASEAPMPLEALLQSQTPRAAYLYTPPSTANTRPAAPELPVQDGTRRPAPRARPAPPPVIAPDDPQQRGGLDPAVRPG